MELIKVPKLRVNQTKDIFSTGFLTNTNYVNNFTPTFISPNSQNKTLLFTKSIKGI